jgi:HD-like signal output (HDOD) protein
MLPAVASEAMQLIENPDCTIAQYASIVERDSMLTTRMLKIANSAVYNPKQPIVSLHHAVLRLGLLNCQNLIHAASITSLMNRLSLDQEWIRSALWQHSFNTGLLATYLNNAYQFGFQGEEFTAGLIHDFGRTLIAVAEPERFVEIDTLEFDESPEQLVHEDSLIGTDHCRLGAWFAMEQRLPMPIPEVIMCHHSPEMAKESEHLTSLIAVADHMANHLQRCNESVGYDPSSNPFVGRLSSFGDERFERHFLKTALTLMDRAHIESEKMMKI